MKLSSTSGAHLTYCSNIHPGETWDAHFNELKTYLPELKQRLSPDAPFGVGLRLSAKAAGELKDENTRNRFKQWLDDEGLYLFTINGFPYGSFHGERVKDNVYKPDWNHPERLDYTRDLIYILADLLPDGIEGGISTSPISYKYWNHGNRSDELFKNATQRLAEAAHTMAQVEENRGKLIHLDIEPEPDCTLENGSETIDFFTNWLFPVGSDYLAQQYKYGREEAELLIRRHIRVCYDTCHFALAYEDPNQAVQELHNAGILIGKTQISAALKVSLGDPDQRKKMAERLERFDEPVYLHQVIARKEDSTFKQFRDLPDALNSIHDETVKEWRVHFHVPVFIDRFDEMSSTQDHIKKSLKPLLDKAVCKHFEIETYTWDVLPDHLKSDLADSIEREYRWTLEQFETL
ncbi:xylose isomerase [Rhodohalobacter sp. SW132]|uniref:metabolite traffic protein EboE n=1 Tax=Rhodohalobacter sp. SW132 TaxID=2293433 RepID=UPI000E245A6C|nr:metabolite traffic protein EboE [Rhodohalobacter sp. SW132]REL37581.1 xylose isomerase [Rhodohalobacter sp. SW132]